MDVRNEEGLTPLLLLARDVHVFEKMGRAVKGYNPEETILQLLKFRA